MAFGRFVLAAGLAALAGCVQSPPRTPPVDRLLRDDVDSARTDWGGRGPRPLATTIWYPAAQGSRETAWGADGFDFGRAARGAPFVDGIRRPVIVLSHGTGGSAAQLSWLAEPLAAAGFVVVGVNRRGNTATEARYYPAGFVLPWERARDLSVVLDRVAADSVIGPHLDTTCVGAAGFSLGGYTVLALAGARLPFAEWRRRCATTRGVPGCALPPEAPFTLATVDTLTRTNAPFLASVARADASTRDLRIRAGFAMAPALVPALDTTSLQAIAVPLRVLLGGSDTQVSPDSACFRNSVQASRPRTRWRALWHERTGGHVAWIAGRQVKCCGGVPRRFFRSRSSSVVCDEMTISPASARPAAQHRCTINRSSTGRCVNAQPLHRGNHLDFNQPWDTPDICVNQASPRVAA